MDLPNESVSKELIAHYAKIRSLLDSEIAAPPLVLPNSRFFPDAFSPTPAGVSTLLKRLQAHAGITDIPVRIQFAADEPLSTGGCGSGACAPSAPVTTTARIVDTGEHWQINLSAEEVRHAVALTTLLARSLGAIVLEEVRGIERIPAPADISCDLAAVQLGFGCLLLEGSHVYSKSCGGPNIASLTALGVNELAVAVALFAAQNGHRLAAAKRSASTTQRAALGLAEELIANNASLVRTLKAAPASLVAKDFSLRAPKARWWGLFDRRRSDDEALEQALLEPSLAPSTPTRQLPVARKLATSEDDDLKRLVSESLSESRAG